MLIPNGDKIYSAGLIEFSNLVYNTVISKDKYGKKTEWETIYKALMILDTLENASLYDESINVLYNCLKELLNIYDSFGYPTLSQPTLVTANQGPPGPAGPKGDNGLDGIDGSDGVSIVFLGSFASAPVSPSINNAYRNTTTKRVELWDGSTWQLLVQDGSNGSNGTNGTNGIDGLNGSDGNTVLNGVGTPSNSLGVNGDFYIDTLTYNIYGPKTAGSWGSPATLRGANGTNGTNGTDGLDGVKGDSGIDGVNAYIYIAYADDSTGTGYTLVSSNDPTATLNSFNSSKEWIAVLTSNIALGSSITVTNFSGLFAKYRGTGDKWSTQSGTSLTIGTAVQNLFVDTGLAYVTGQRTVIAVTGQPQNRMEGYCVSYNPSNGQLVIDVDTVTGSGTFNVWDVSLQASLPNSNEFPFSNLDVDIGTEDVDTVSTSIANRIEWEYLITKGSNSGSGVISVAINGTSISASDYSLADIGTVDVTLDVDISAGNVRLRATATSDNWIVKGLRRIIA